MKINHIDRYGSYTGDYVYYVHYENGDIKQETQQTLSKEAIDFMSANNSEYQFRKNKRGEFYHRYAAK